MKVNGLSTRGFEMSDQTTSDTPAFPEDLSPRERRQYALQVAGDPQEAQKPLDDGTLRAFWAVHHSPEAARKVLEDPHVYTLANPETRWSVAHEAVKQDRGAAQQALDDPSIYRLANQNGYTVLHMAIKRWESVAAEALGEPRMYKLSESDGQTVAHCAVDAHPQLAASVLDDPDIYTLQAEFGDTVAHWAAEGTAKAGLKALGDPGIYRMTGRKGRRVAGRCCAHKRPARQVLSDPDLRSLEADGPGQSVVEWALSHYPEAVEALLELPALWSEVLSDQETFLGFALRHHPEIGTRILDRNRVASTPATPTERIAHIGIEWSDEALLKVCSDPELAALEPPKGGVAVGSHALLTSSNRQVIEDRINQLARQGQLEDPSLEGLWKVYIQHGPRWANRFRNRVKSSQPELFERLSLLTLSAGNPELRKEALRDLGRPVTRSS